MSVRVRIRMLLAAVIGAAILLGASGCTAGSHDRRGERYVIASGGETGVYAGYGDALARVLSRQLDPEFSSATTEGSVDNLLRLGSGEALLGFAQSDAAADAVAGTGAFDRPVPIRAVARLYDEYVHVVVRADSQLRSLGDLAGRTVSLGAPNSGVNLVATRVLNASGVDTVGLDNRGLGLDASIAALDAGEIDAFFWVGGVPTPGLEELAAELPIRLLPVDSDAVDRLNALHDGTYRVSEFPLGSYGWDSPTVTMTVPNFLVVPESAPDDLVREVVAVLFDSRTELAQNVTVAALLDRRQAIFTEPIALHPGAAAYYTDLKR